MSVCDKQVGRTEDDAVTSGRTDGFTQLPAQFGTIQVPSAAAPEEPAVVIRLYRLRVDLARIAAQGHWQSSHCPPHHGDPKVELRPAVVGGPKKRPAHADRPKAIQWYRKERVRLKGRIRALRRLKPRRVWWTHWHTAKAQELGGITRLWRSATQNIFQFWPYFFVMFVAALGYGTLGPTFALFLKEDVVIASGWRGFLMGSRSFLGQSMGLFGGRLSDKYNPKIVMVVGYFCRALGFVMLSLHTWWSVLLGIPLLGLGGLGNVALKALLARAVGKERKGAVMADYQVVANVAFSASHGGTAFFDSRPLLYILSAIATGVSSLLVVVLRGRKAAPKAAGATSERRPHQQQLPNQQPHQQPPHQQQLLKKQSWREDARELWAMPEVKTLLGYNFAFWFVYSLFDAVIPMQTMRMLGKPGLLTFFQVNGWAVILLTRPLTGLAERRFSPVVTLRIGMLCLAGGLLAFRWGDTFTGLALGGLLFTFGEILGGSPADAYAAGLHDRLQGTLLGLTALAGAVGSLMGGMLMTPLYEYLITVTIPGVHLFAYLTGAIAAAFGLIVCRTPNTAKAAQESGR